MPYRSALVFGSLALGGLALSACVVVAVVPSMAGKGPDLTADPSSASGGAHQQEMPTYGAGANLAVFDHGSWERLFWAWGR